MRASLRPLDLVVLVELVGVDHELDRAHRRRRGRRAAGVIATRNDCEAPAPIALRRYERIRPPRTARLQELSKGEQDPFHLPDGPAQQERDRQMATSGDRSLPALTWLYAHDATDIEPLRG